MALPNPIRLPLPRPVSDRLAFLNTRVADLQSEIQSLARLCAMSAGIDVDTFASWQIASEGDRVFLLLRPTPGPSPALAEPQQPSTPATPAPVGGGPCPIDSSPLFAPAPQTPGPAQPA